MIKFFIKLFNLYPKGVILKTSPYPKNPQYLLVELGKRHKRLKHFFHKRHEIELLADYKKIICVFIPSHLKEEKEIHKYILKQPEAKLKY